MINKKFAAIAAIAAVGAVVLVGCSSGSSSSSSSSASASTSESPIGGNVLPPVMVEPGTKAVEAKVGDTIVFKVADPENAKIATDNEAVLEVMQGGKQGDAMMNPGAKALAAGTATVTVGSETVTVTVK